MLLVINTDPISEHHICWYTNDHGKNKIELHEVVRREYRHPQDVGSCTVPVIETKIVGVLSRFSDTAAAWVLLEANEKVIKKR